jgi:hypothetical protein
MLSDEDLEAQERTLRAEADALLRRYGVLGTLRRFGTPHIIGSYAMRLMTWRDLDIYLEMPSCETTSFLELGCEVGKALAPRRLSFVDHLHFPPTEGLHGLYWGIRTDDLSRGGWKIDLWGVAPPVCAERLAYGERLAARIDAQGRRSILAIKHEVCRLPEYRKTITSHHVYEAVLSGNARTIADFWYYMNADGKLTGASPL